MVERLDGGLWVSFLKKREKNGMNGETMSKRERERENVFMVSDCRLHPAV